MIIKILKVILFMIFFGMLGWLAWSLWGQKTQRISSHKVLLERIESMGKLELVKYRISDVIEHKEVSQYLPDASVLLIIKADAVGCIDLAKLSAGDVEVIGDSAKIVLPSPEICYVKIDHKDSKVYDTKMAFFREATLVDDAFKSAEKEINQRVQKSDILEQTKRNAEHVFKPLLEGLGFRKFSISFK